MAGNRQAAGLTVIRVGLGVFFLFEAVSKLAWLTDAGILARQLGTWLEAALPWPRWYLEHVAIPGAWAFARVVTIAEAALGLALVLGVLTRTAALLGFVMVLNFHFASGALFQYGFLTNGYGLPVLASLLCLAIGGSKLPLSLRK